MIGPSLWRETRSDSIPPRTTWKSDSPTRLKENYGRQSKPPSAVQFLKRTLTYHEASKPFRAGSTDRLDGARDGCHEKYFVPAAGRRRDIFIDSPFQRTLRDFWRVIVHSRFREHLSGLRQDTGIPTIMGGAVAAVPQPEGGPGERGDSRTPRFSLQSHCDPRCESTPTLYVVP